MKRIKLIYVLLLAMAMPLLTACSSEDTLGNSDPTQSEQGEKITVRFRVSQAGTNTMRAWEDKVAEDKEMMNAWVVVGVNTSDNKVVGIWACKPKGDGQEEIDELEELPEEGSYRFYSFANMSPVKVMELLSINSPTSAGEGEILASAFSSVTDNEIVKIAFSDKTVTVNAGNNNIPVKVEGNGFNKFAVGEDNGFSYYGIPMSNVQTIENIQDQTTINLIVVRMLAKIKIQLYNDCGTDITINSITLTDLTANTNEESGSNGNNLMLLPNLEKGGNTMESNPDYHADIQPNLNGTPTQAEYIYVPATGSKVVGKGVTSTTDAPVEYTFYVNESENPKGSNKDITTPSPSSPQDFYRYFLKINLTKTVEVPGESGGASTTKTVEEVRYTLIDNNKKENTGDKWNYIARNDYRIIPIVLDDFEFKIIPYDFPAIGVLPASVKEEDGVYTINFHDYGHFHLLPQVTKYSNGEVVPYGNSGSVYWNLEETTNNLTASQLLSGTLTTNGVWGSWTDATKKTPYVNANAAGYDGYNGIPFYKPDYNPSTPIEDGDEVGGEPVWYVNDNPEWVETQTPRQPFIFGFIADPNPEQDPNYVSTDRKVYHEFTINLHKNGSNVVRPMTYRLYMILDTDQMLYRSNTNGAPRIRQPHCTH